MRINLIGSGWLASPLAQQLQAAGHQVLVTTTQPEKACELAAAGLSTRIYALGDQLSDPNSLFDTDVLIIAITSKDLAAFDVLMDQINDTPCQHIIYISSTSVYANDGQQHDETSTALNPDNPLLQIEHLIQTHRSATIIRMAGLVGPDRHPGLFFRHGRVMKNPDAPVNLIHQTDCIGIIQSVITQGAWNEVFNACADTHPKKAVFYAAMSQQINADTPKTEITNAGSFKTISNHKIKSKLGYQLVFPDVMNMTF